MNDRLLEMYKTTDGYTCAVPVDDIEKKYHGGIESIAKEDMSQWVDIYML
jgi:hypothetical protein